MEYEVKNGGITFFLSGRINSENSERINDEINAVLEKEKGMIPSFDVQDLEYISSAGLRVLMKTAKKYDRKLRVFNAKPEVYEIFDMTGFTGLFDVKKEYRSIDVSGCEVIGKGFYGTVYRLDEDTIVKAYDSPDALSMIENERSMARLAFMNGIPTPISYDVVRIGENYGTVFELLRSKTFNDMIIDEPERTDAIIREYVDFMKMVHGTVLEEGTLPFARDVFIKNLDDLGDYLPASVKEQLKELLLAVPDDHHVVHGDFQMKNVMLSSGEPMLIDMDTVSCGQPIFDLQGLYMTYVLFAEDEPDNTMNFLGISRDTASHIMQKVLEFYYEKEDPDTVACMSDSIRLLSYLRFLHIICGSHLKEGGLGETRIRHTVEHITELLPQIKSLV